MTYVPFWDAAYQGDLERMREIIAKDPPVVDRHPPLWKSVYRPTALAYAVWGNQLGAVRLLLENGANPNLADGVRTLSRPFRAKRCSPAPHLLHLRSSRLHLLFAGRQLPSTALGQLQGRPRRVRPASRRRGR